MRPAALLLALVAACSPTPREVLDVPTSLVEVDGYAPASLEGLRAQGWRTEFTPGSLPPERIRAAGLPRGLFQPLRDLRREPAAEVALDDSEPVLVLRGADAVHAWPLVHLLRRELALDEVDGLPLAVTYCSLCDSARLFDRRVAGEVLELAVSGMLLEGNALLHDARTDSLWSQRDGRCIAGTFVGRRLVALPAFVVSLGALRAAHPTAAVRAAPEDGAPDPPLVLLGAEQLASGDAPPWLRAAGAAPLERLLCLDAGPGALARGERVEHLPGAVLLRDPATASPHRAAHGGPGPALGSAAAFRPQLDGRALTFETDGSWIRDRETGSRWNPLGEAVEGPLAGRRLEPLPQVASLRFALPPR